ncbi:hypothetical protein G3A39_00305 [Paraburkholderia aspalathi]|uniref:hypothetical protein n=1 Tax=Paraburkholderia nemoris TaxID=2793076 RepID=UPI00190B3685|nr:hypothetical protein [Paraburkholderia nemoris]MBK3737649.1 hypothetical protein [Paraburkholderia aspalathi]
MGTLATHHLILTYLTWRMRFVPVRSRKVAIWSGGVDPHHFAAIASQVRPLIGKVERGEDLTPHLSGLVNTLGFAMPEVSAEKRRHKKDHVLTKTGLHHFHVGAMTGANPRGRSGRLVFADVTDDEFKIIAISDHAAFSIGSAEWTRLFGISNRYIQSQLPAGAAYMAFPTVSSGHPLELVVYADHCDEMMTQTDSRLDDRAFVESLYSENNAVDGQPLLQPARPTFKWHFENCDFGMLETKTRTFFRVYFSPR